VDVQAFVKAEGGLVGGEPPVERGRADPSAPLRSDGHSALDPAACCICGRASSAHWPMTSGAQSQTLSTLRRLGGDPFLAPVP
jgi:hypothetical protein